MKFKAFTLVLLSFFLLQISACGQAQKAEKSVSLIQAKELDQIKSELVIIDVRTPEEYAEGHLENAVNINYYDDDFKEQLSDLDKSKKVVVYCKLGGRSAKAAAVMDELGFEEVYDLDGGFTSWKDEDLEVKH